RRGPVPRRRPAPDLPRGHRGRAAASPVSSLGHSILIPALIGGRWARDLNLTADRSPYTASGYHSDGKRGVSAGHADDEAAAIASDHRLAALGWPQALLIGAAQILALLPGISRSGATMTAGLPCGLTHQDAARFAFL